MKSISKSIFNKLSPAEKSLVMSVSEQLAKWRKDEGRNHTYISPYTFILEGSFAIEGHRKPLVIEALDHVFSSFSLLACYLTPVNSPSFMPVLITTGQTRGIGRNVNDSWWGDVLGRLPDINKARAEVLRTLLVIARKLQTRDLSKPIPGIRDTSKSLDDFCMLSTLLPDVLTCLEHREMRRLIGLVQAISPEDVVYLYEMPEFIGLGPDTDFGFMAPPGECIPEIGTVFIALEDLITLLEQSCQ